MKKFFTILVTICLMVGVLIVTAITSSAASQDPAEGIVMRVSALKKNGTSVVIKDYDNFEEGWEAAIDYAEDTETMKTQGYERVVVDFYADWTANKDGEFGDGGDGFEYSTIHITEDIRITLNLNNHTIDRDLSGLELNGEVIYVDEKADLIINNGTIKGGFSENGAGGIHIKNGANVTLNNVNIEGNRVYDDDGAGIAVYKGATLTMNGGSFKDNLVDVYLGSIYAVQGSAVYVEKGTAIFDGVTFDSNYTGHKNIDGAAIYADEGDITVKNCTFEGNGIENSDKNIVSPDSIIHNVDGLLTITNSNFTNNKASYLFYVKDCDFHMEGGKITQNSGKELFYFNDSESDITGVTITENQAGVMHVNNDHEIINVIKCVLGNNTPNDNNAAVEIEKAGNLTMIDCVLGDTTFSNIQYVKITTSEVTREEAVIGIELLREDGTVDSVRYYKDFASGWDYATECAKSNFFDRVVVTLYADWNTNEYGAVTIPSNARMTLNMNGHTINRGLGKNNQNNGEVICVNNGADLIINGGKEGDAFVKPGENTENIPMGKITGGNSDNGAGGIHIHDEARVTLNNVNIVENTTDDDEGAGIAAYDGAVLIMNGGSISNNLLWCSFHSYDYPDGSLYLNDSTAYLNGVEFVGNQFAGNYSAGGVAIYAADSTLIAENCTFKENGNRDAVYQGRVPNNVIELDEGSIELINCVFEDNGTPGLTSGAEMVELRGGTIKISNSVFRNNISDSVIECFSGILEVSDTVFEGNTKSVFLRKADAGSFFKNCTFSGNTKDEAYKTFEFYEDNNLNFENCNLGDSTFNDRSLATFNGAAGVGSIFGEGSLAMIVSFVALIASVAAIVVNVSSKKKAVPVAANGAADTENDDEE